MKEMVHWKDEALKLKTSLKETSNEVQAKIASVEGARASAVKLEGQLKELRAELKQAQGALEVAVAGSMSNCMQRLKNIEGRGYIKVDRQNGCLKFAKALDFKPSSEAEPPVPEFADPREATKALADIAEVVKLFDVPVSVEIQSKLPKGAQQAAWDQLTNGWAELLKVALVKEGVLGDHVSARGLSGAKLEDSVVIQLDRTMFAEQPVVVAKGKKK